jgi:drug/metabolite transporter (DMT)-like permease
VLCSSVIAYKVVIQMTWLLLTILAVICRSVYSIAAKLLTNDVHVSPGTQNFLMTFSSLVPSLLLSPLLGGLQFDPIHAHLEPVIIMILTASFGGIAFFKGQQRLEASIAQIAFSSILLWGLILSIIFLGSRFNIVQLLGVALLFCAILLVHVHTGRLKLNVSVIWILIAAAFFAAFQVSSASLSKHLTTATYLLLSFGGPTVVVGGLYAGTIKKDMTRVLKHPKTSARILSFLAATTFGYYVFSFKAYSHAPNAGIVVILLTTQVILSVILGILLLKERDHKTRKVAAGILAFIAGALIKTG